MDEIGPSLRYATAKVNRAQRGNGQAPAQGGLPAPAREGDPWAGPAQQGPAGWGNGGPLGEPPF